MEVYVLPASLPTALFLPHLRSYPLQWVLIILGLTSLAASLNLYAPLLTQPLSKFNHLYNSCIPSVLASAPGSYAQILADAPSWSVCGRSPFWMLLLGSRRWRRLALSSAKISSRISLDLRFWLSLVVIEIDRPTLNFY